ncbi:MAG: hypothetical protein V3U13_03095 [Gemmatimonadota bacterium]
MAIDLDRKRSYYAADYEGEAWDRMTFVMLSNDETWAALAVHVRPIEQAAVDDGEELRELQGVRSRAETTDYVQWGNLDPDSYERFLAMLFEGVEDRNSKETTGHIIYAGADNLIVEDNGDLSAEFLPGRRRATQAQLDRAMKLCFPSYLTPSDELTPDQKKGISEFKQDRQGNIMIRTHAMEGSKELARLGGHYKDPLKISFDDQNILTAALTRAWGEVVKEKIQDLAEDPNVWMTEVVEGVKKKLGGGG